MCLCRAKKKTFLMSNENGFSMNKVQNWWISFLSLFLIEKKRKNDNKFVSESKRIVMAMIDDTKHEIPVPKIEIYSRQKKGGVRVYVIHYNEEWRFVLAWNKSHFIFYGTQFEMMECVRMCLLCVRKCVRVYVCVSRALDYLLYHFSFSIVAMSSQHSQVNESRKEQRNYHWNEESHQ